MQPDPVSFGRNDSGGTVPYRSDRNEGAGRSSGQLAGRYGVVKFDLSKNTHCVNEKNVLLSFQNNVRGGSYGLSG